MELTGQSFIGSRRGSRDGARAFRPSTRKRGEALLTRSTARPPLRSWTRPSNSPPGPLPAIRNPAARPGPRFCAGIADGFDTHREELAERAHLETALPMPRLLGEVGRTAGQLRMFAGVVEEGSWVQARIDPALPDRQPMPRPDIRSMLRPLGPVAVFGASNFPLAFSVAGRRHGLRAGRRMPCGREGASSASGNGRNGGADHRGSCRRGRIASRRLFSGVRQRNRGRDAALVKHPLIRAVAFTGSLRGGRALMDLAAARPDPIPCFTEMSSGNPVFVLPGALRKGANALAKGLFGSFTLGAGQFCTKPGIVLYPDAPEGRSFVAELGALVEQSQPFTLLTPGISREYARATEARGEAVSQTAARLDRDPGAGMQRARRLFTASVWLSCSRILRWPMRSSDRIRCWSNATARRILSGPPRHSKAT